MIEHLETVHEEEKRNIENNNMDQRSTGTLCIKKDFQTSFLGQEQS